MDALKVLDTVRPYQDRMLRCGWFSLQDGKPRYCIVSALLHAAELVVHYDLLMTQQDSDPARVWRMYGRDLKHRYGIASYEEMLSLVEVNAAAPSDQAVYETLRTYSAPFYA